jgi:hypothetical protein
MVAPLVMSAALAIAQEFLPSLAEKLRGQGSRKMAEAVVSAAAAAAGVSPTTPASQMIARLKTDSGATAELRQELQMIDKEVYESELQDRQLARLHRRESSPEDRTRGNLMVAGVWIGLVLCILASIWGTQGTGENRNLDPGVLALITTVAGALLKMLSDAFAFEFGSSRGSRDKSLLLAEQNEQLTTASAQDKWTALEALRETRSQIPAVAERVAKATSEAMVTGAAAATVAAEAVTKPRDFVGQLVRGEI